MVASSSPSVRSMSASCLKRAGIPYMSEPLPVPSGLPRSDTMSVLFPGNCPKNVSKDAKYGIKSNKKGGMAVGLTYCTDDDEIWHPTTEAHPELAEMVSAIKTEYG